MAIFKINPQAENGLELIHEFNNDVMPNGVKPIPTGPVSEDILKESENTSDNILYVVKNETSISILGYKVGKYEVFIY